MAQHIFITYNNITKDVANSICKNIFVNSMIKTELNQISGDDLILMARKSTTEFFYVISTDLELDFSNFNFSYKPPEWDKSYLHIWNNNLSVRLYNKHEVIRCPDEYSDQSIYNGTAKFKILNDTSIVHKPYDMVFLSYDEPFANTQYEKLKQKFSHRLLRVHGVTGIYEAHKSAAEIANTSMFYVVDADAEIEDTFNFDFEPSIYDTRTVHVWNSRNPINDLIYGYGGVKLFPRRLVLEYQGSPIDFTTSVSKSFKVMSEISNTTNFNTDPFSTWRSAFRECSKLSSKIISAGVDKETEERLHVWCTVGADRQFGEFAIKGAKDGAEFGMTHKDQPEILGLINDYKWLKQRFNS